MELHLDAPAPDPGVARTTGTQAALSRIVAAFIGAWQTTGDPPDLAAHLPTDAALRRAALIELIKVDLQHRWSRSRKGPSLADYRRKFPELDTAPLPPDLIFEEITARTRRDGPIDLTEYETQYPQQMSRISHRLDDQNFRTTLLSDPTARTALDALAAGTTVDDFDLLIPLGQGAFARVFLARQRSLHRLVAIKISRDRGSEPQTLAQLDHDHIVRVFDQRQLADQHLKLMYMQYIPGGTLLGVLRHLHTIPVARRSGRTFLDAVDDAVAAGGVIETHPSPVRTEIARLTWPETVAWLGARLAAALNYADHHGVLHRDIKPANILLTVDGQPKLVDFNISFSAHIPGANPAAYFGGSLAYMSPEQLAACHPTMAADPADLDTRSDLYALGVVLWELLTGSLPFADNTGAGESDSSLARMIELRKQPVAARYEAALPADTPPILRHALLTCLSPDPADRHTNGADLAHQLELTLDRTARDLVDPPEHSIRARLRNRPMPVVTVSSILGQLIGGLYLMGHNTRLLQHALTASAWTQLHHLGLILIAVGYPLGVLLLLYWCRSVFVVPEGIRHGKRYDEPTLARARADTLACGDRIAAVAFMGWIAALGIFLLQLRHTADLSPGLLANLIASHVVAAAVAVVYTYFPVTFFVLRWYYPGLVAAGHTSHEDTVRLRRLARRLRVYLGVVASVPLLGVATGLAFLSPAEQQLVTESLVALCVGGIVCFLLTLRVFYALDSDLRALYRISDPHE
ncbi:serine/threonine protein kinase [Nocardia panacis]|uniref:Serine/threonine protein kinase n=1 Tax=Nocardia panacis TaxID=2340916 RepID=A0A3A4KXL4_9NOCA|nr:serine/threonine-protein kinase [Nocardia panacis]RJO78449.1 serine/threonine protein kinase [Nocardia panacis]